jgi:hypothetical protein
MLLLSLLYELKMELTTFENFILNVMYKLLSVQCADINNCCNNNKCCNTYGDMVRCNSETNAHTRALKQIRPVTATAHTCHQLSTSGRGDSDGVGGVVGGGGGAAGGGVQSYMYYNARRPTIEGGGGGRGGGRGSQSQGTNPNSLPTRPSTSYHQLLQEAAHQHPMSHSQSFSYPSRPPSENFLSATRPSMSCTFVNRSPSTPTVLCGGEGGERGNLWGISRVDPGQHGVEFGHELHFREV